MFYNIFVNQIFTHYLWSCKGVTHFTRIKISKKEKMKAVIEKNDISNKNIDPKMTLILSASSTFEQKLFIFSKKKSTKRYEWTLFLNLHKELRNVSFFFSLSDFSLKIVVQLMVICKKKFFYSILHTILLYHKFTQWHSLSFAPVKTVDATLHEAHCTIITETKRNWWKNISWPAFAIGMAWHHNDPICIPNSIVSD